MNWDKSLPLKNNFKMKNKRRQFIKQTALAGLGVAGGKWLNASVFDRR